MVGGKKAAHPPTYFLASGIAAACNLPLWKAAAIGQAGFQGVPTDGFLRAYLRALAPPYKGFGTTWLGMTWARFAVFFGTERGKELMKPMGIEGAFAGALPALVISTGVQVINMPIIRATISLQDPRCQHPNALAALRWIYENKGVQGLWRGTSAGILKTVPKYCTAIVVKDSMEEWLDPTPAGAPRSEELKRSATKSVAAGLAGAVLTNPLDVLRNEMFKTDLRLTEVLRGLWRNEGGKFLVRGLDKNVIAVTIPVALTIFLCDQLEPFVRGIEDSIREYRHQQRPLAEEEEQQPPSSSSMRYDQGGLRG